MPEPVAFLFADVQGSTALVRRLGDHWAGALAQLRGLLHEAIVAGDGRVVDARGDEVFAVFPTAAVAADAALTAQRRLHDEQWPGDALIALLLAPRRGTRSQD